MSSASRTMISSYSCEMRPPRLLKDFLLDDSSLPSCSSNGFSLYQSKSNKTSTHNSHFQLLRNRSKSTSISISAIHKASERVIKAIKFFPFASIVKSPSLLPRSISRKKSNRTSNKNSLLGETAVSTNIVTPKIKDILRWKSFRDVVEEMSTSWLESDFTAEELTSLGTDHENYDFMDPKNKVEGEFPYDDQNELQSPVSVLNDSPFRDDHEGSVSFFNRTVSSMERRKCMLMQRIEEFETLSKLEPVKHEERLLFAHDEKKSIITKEDHQEETNYEVEAKARQLLGHIKATTSSAKNNSEADHADINIVLLDFFRHELANIISSKKQKDVELSEAEMLKFAKTWMSREYCCEGTFDCELLDNREACIMDMEAAGLMSRWKNNNFEEEQQELGCELEIEFLNDLFDELWADLVTQSNIQ